MNFAHKLRDALTSDIFCDHDLYIAKVSSNGSAILSGLSRSLKSLEIIRLKRGVYMFGDNLRRGPVSKFAIAGKLYFPSYISFESALAFHGLIPEGVYVTTSACQLSKKKLFQTPLGEFSFDHAPCAIFFMGVESIKGNGLVANPLRALFDLIYLRRKNYGRLEDVESDLRIDPCELIKLASQYSYTELRELALSYRRKNVIRFFELLVQESK
jgi:hypothetical protein